MDVLLIGVVAAIFVTVFALLLLAALVGILRWHRNNQAPVLSVPAVVMAKRQETRGGSGDLSVRTAYYVTFQVQGGDRIEIALDGREFGLLVERDRGLLTHQGTRFKSFSRAPQDV